MTFRRIALLALLHFVAMVCYPHFGIGGFSFGVISFGVWSFIAIIFGIISAIFLLDKWQKFNGLVTAVLLIGALWTMLSYMPQENKISPIKKISYGQFPKTADINTGLKNFGINIEGVVNWVKGAKGQAQSLNDADKRMRRAVEGL